MYIALRKNRTIPGFKALNERSGNRLLNEFVYGSTVALYDRPVLEKSGASDWFSLIGRLKQVARPVFPWPVKDNPKRMIEERTIGTGSVKQVTQGAEPHAVNNFRCTAGLPVLETKQPVQTICASRTDKPPGTVVVTTAGNELSFVKLSKLIGSAATGLPFKSPINGQAGNTVLENTIVQKNGDNGFIVLPTAGARNNMPDSGRKRAAVDPGYLPEPVPAIALRQKAGAETAIVSVVRGMTSGRESVAGDVSHLKAAELPADFGNFAGSELNRDPDLQVKAPNPDNNLLKKLVDTVNTGQSKNQNINLDLALPNVTRADTFVSELQSIVEMLS